MDCLPLGQRLLKGAPPPLAPLLVYLLSKLTLKQFEAALWRPTCHFENIWFSATTGQSFHLSSKLAQHLLDGLAQTSVQTFMFARKCILIKKTLMIL